MLSSRLWKSFYAGSWKKSVVFPVGLQISSDHSVLASFCQSAFSSTCIVSVSHSMSETFVHDLASEQLMPSLF